MPNLFLFAFFFIISLYFLQAMLLLWGSFRQKPTNRRSARAGQTVAERDIKPAITVIVPARDEEKHISGCLEALCQLHYPQEKLEIIAVDDRSKDRTGEIISDFVRKNGRFKSINVVEDTGELSGKANAIAKGLEESSGEIILLTDADCRVPATWAERMVSYFADDVGVVGGFTLLTSGNTILFGRIQSLDWIFLLTIAAGAVGLGRPLSAIGNNLAIRRAAFKEVGGYSGIGFSVTEDFALVKAVAENTKWKVVFSIEPEAMVESHPLPSFREFYHQRKRWVIGGRNLGFYGKFLMTLGFFVHFLLPISFFLAPKLLYPLSAMLVIFVADFSLLLRSTWALKCAHLLKYFLLFEAFYFFYTTFFAFPFFYGKVKWKGTEYS